MKKKTRKVLALGLMMTILFTNNSVSNAASYGSAMEKTLKYYRQGKYSKAETYNKKLPKVITENCVKKMSSGMKKAYLKVVKKYAAKKDKDLGISYLWDYFLTDIDNDKKADLLLKYGTCEADVKLIVFQYKKGKAVRTGSTYAGNTSFFAYPDHKGIVAQQAHMGCESISVVTFKKGRLVYTNSAGRGVGDADYFALRGALKPHMVYKEGKSYISYKDLK